MNVLRIAVAALLLLALLLLPSSVWSKADRLVSDAPDGIVAHAPICRVQSEQFMVPNS